MISKIKNRIKQNKFIYHKYGKVVNSIKKILDSNFAEERNIDLAKFKDVVKNERCFIIGNGPSLKIKDLEKIKMEYTFASNRIFTIYDETDFRPTYYFAQDQKTIKRNFVEIKTLKSIKFIRRMRGYLDSSFINYTINNSNYYSKEPPKFSTDITKGVYDGYSVTYSMIQIAVYMGFKEIYLLGVDTNYTLVNGKIDNSSYSHKKMFDKEKIGGLPDINYNLMAYKVAKDYADINNIKIYNATRGGMLETFPRVDFDEIVRID